MEGEEVESGGGGGVVDKVKMQNGTLEKIIDLSIPTKDAMSKTTTISTIAVQSGKTRLVIALLNVRKFLSKKKIQPKNL